MNMNPCPRSYWLRLAAMSVILIGAPVEARAIDDVDRILPGDPCLPATIDCLARCYSSIVKLPAIRPGEVVDPSVETLGSFGDRGERLTGTQGPAANILVPSVRNGRIVSVFVLRKDDQGGNRWKPFGFELPAAAGAIRAADGQTHFVQVKTPLPASSGPGNAPLVPDSSLIDIAIMPEPGALGGYELSIPGFTSANARSLALSGSTEHSGQSAPQPASAYVSAKPRTPPYSVKEAKLFVFEALRKAYLDLAGEKAAPGTSRLQKHVNARSNLALVRDLAEPAEKMFLACNNLVKNALADEDLKNLGVEYMEPLWAANGTLRYIVGNPQSRARISLGSGGSSATTTTGSGQADQ